MVVLFVILRLDGGDPANPALPRLAWSCPVSEVRGTLVRGFVSEFWLAMPPMTKKSAAASN
jgi:hypothetical protein